MRAGFKFAPRRYIFMLPRYWQRFIFAQLGFTKYRNGVMIVFGVFVTCPE